LLVSPAFNRHYMPVDYACLKKNESTDLEDCRFSYNGMPAITGGSINSYDEQEHRVFYAGPMSRHLHPKHYLGQKRSMAWQHRELQWPWRQTSSGA
jgi:hypothetical protein